MHGYIYSCITYKGLFTDIISFNIKYNNNNPTVLFLLVTVSWAMCLDLSMQYL